MKKILILGLSAIAFSCAKKSTSEYHINGNLTGFDGNETVYVMKISDSNRQIVIDSTSLENGKFSIDLPKVESKDFNFIKFSKTPGNILLIAENEQITVTADKDDLRGAKIEGGKENQVFSEYLAKIGELRDVETKIAESSRAAAQAGDYAELKEIKKESDSLTQAKKQLRLETLEKHPNSIVSVMALSDLVSLKMISSTKANEIFANMETDLKESRLGINAKKALSLMFDETSEIGDQVADFDAPTPAGEKLNLKKSLGKVTLLDFWASWCRPCRVENPNVVRVYNKYHDKGLEIISISLDKSAEKWKQAIEADGLKWNHVSHLQFWQEPIAKRFGVRAIPAAFLLDEKGVIIAKNLRGQALEDKISEVLSN